ncbi:MAG: hypothetical protein PHQ23_01530, partial [Candidatus Wallbacteria bacterium]|nr:hypothetical protein [Candidatus Wallbacteria bacterium]
TTLASVDLRLPEFSASLVQGHVISFDRLKSIYERISALPLLERRRLPGMDPNRADTLPCGCLILLEIMACCRSRNMYASHVDLMYGYALSRAMDKSPGSR